MSLLLLLRSRQEVGVTATAEWVQAPASWAATASETITGTAAFSQAPAAWSATVSEQIGATASWVQAPASWIASESDLVNSTGEWTQSNSWAAELSQVLQQGGGGFAGRRPMPFRPAPEIQLVTVRASFVQQPAQWSADMDVDRMPADIEDLVLAGVL